jgi:hypothetical protein
MAMRGPSEELYDTQADPHEIQNLAKSAKPEHRETLLRLRSALDTWIVETGDRGKFPSPVPPGEEEMLHNWFGTPAWYRQQTRNP